MRRFINNRFYVKDMQEGMPIRTGNSEDVHIKKINEKMKAFSLVEREGNVYQIPKEKDFIRGKLVTTFSPTVAFPLRSVEPYDAVKTHVCGDTLENVFSRDFISDEAGQFWTVQNIYSYPGASWVRILLTSEEIVTITTQEKFKPENPDDDDYRTVQKDTTVRHRKLFIVERDDPFTFESTIDPYILINEYAGPYWDTEKKEEIWLPVNMRGLGIYPKNTPQPVPKRADFLSGKYVFKGDFATQKHPTDMGIYVPEKKKTVVPKGM